MKTLTVLQPWASLVAVGAKSIETRSRTTSYRGPLAIHAGASQRWVGIDFWERHERERAKAIHLALVEGGFGPTPSFPPYPSPGDDCIVGVPMGAVVATCQLVDVVPIGGPTTFSTGLVEGEEPPTAGVDVVVAHINTFDDCLVLDRWDGPNEVITDQLPYGDFTPGRWAWLLADVRALPEPVPAKGRQGLWTVPEGLLWERSA